MAHHWLAGAI